MSDTIDILKKLALQVRNAVDPAENTAERVGRVLVGLLENLNSVDLEELAKTFLRKDQPGTASEVITFLKGLLIGDNTASISEDGDAEVRNLIARIKATVAALEAKTVTVSDKVTTLNLLVQKLAETYDLNVSNVAILFRTIVKDYVSSESFVPGITGEGMKLYKALNGDWNLEVDNVTIRKAMTVFELIISKVRAVNGGLVVSPANGRIKSVTETTGSPTYYVLGIEGDMTFVADDLVRCQVFSSTGAKYYWVPVDSVSGETILILKSEFPDGVVPVIGDDLVQMGNKSNTARQGVLYLTASEDGKPRFSVLDGVSSTNLTGKNKVILGCLDGITDSDFPSDAQPSGYGLWAGNVFLKGLFILRNGKSIEDELSDQITAVQTAFEIREGQISTKVTQATQAAAEASGYAASAAGSASSAGQSLTAITQKESSINQTANEITLKVTRAETAAGRAESAEASINVKADGIVLQASNAAAKTAMDSVQIGGRNYYSNFSTIIQNLVGQATIGKNHPDTPNGLYLVGDSTSTSAIRINQVINSNGYWTISFDIKGSQNTTVGFWIDPCDLGGPTIKTTPDNNWAHHTYTFNVTNYTADVYHFIDFHDISWAYIFIRNLKIEKGNKETDYTPAPEDVTADAQSMANTAENNAKTYVNTNFTTKVEYTAKLQVLNDAINGKVSQTTYDGLASRVESAEAKITSDAINLTVQSQVITYSNLATKLAGAKMLYVDPAFKNSTNSIGVYNNYGNGTVAIDRVERHSDNPTDSNYQIRIVSSGFSQTPGRGGFYFANYAQPYAEYICKFIAWIPTNCSVEFASNSMGSGGYQQWLTPKQGQGKWAEYVSYVRGGDGGNSTTNFYYLNNGSDETVTWWLCYATVFDCSKNEYTPDVYALKAGLEIVSGGIRFFGQGFSFAGKVTIGSLDSTIIENNKIKTSLIDAQAIITGQLVASVINTTDITTGRLTVTDGARVAGFKVSGNSLTNEGFNNDTYIIMRNDTIGTFVGIGATVANQITEWCTTARIENNRKDSPYGNVIALRLSASGCTSSGANVALDITSGYISGLRLQIRTVRTSQTLSVSDGIIISESDSDITLTLPSNPGIGKIYFIRKNGGGRVWIGGSYIINDGDWFREKSTGVQLNRGGLGIIMYNGTYWTWNNMNG